MSHHPDTPLDSRLSRLAGGLLALLLVFAGALLGGQSSGKSGTYQRLTQSHAEIPLVDAAYPRDCTRNAGLRWRHTGTGDDPSDQDPLAAPAAWFNWVAPVSDATPMAVATDTPIVFLLYRPQAPRAPPLV